jgi:hypothetical protein
VPNLKDLGDVLVIWLGQVHTNSETATFEVITKQAKLFGQKMSMANLEF